MHFDTLHTLHHPTCKNGGPVSRAAAVSTDRMPYGVYFGINVTPENVEYARTDT